MRTSQEHRHPAHKGNLPHAKKRVWHLYDGSAEKHWVEDFEGERLSLILFSERGTLADYVDTPTLGAFGAVWAEEFATVIASHLSSGGSEAAKTCRCGARGAVARQLPKPAVVWRSFTSASFKRDARSFGLNIRLI